jgi:hypothetical protein
MRIDHQAVQLIIILCICGCILSKLIIILILLDLENLLQLYFLSLIIEQLT